MSKRTKNQQEAYELTLGYAVELCHVYWMALRHPKAMEMWGKATQAVIRHDFMQNNQNGSNLFNIRNEYLVIRDNATGIVHVFTDEKLRKSAMKDIKSGTYTLIQKGAQFHNDPSPLQMDKLIPFVVPNWAKREEGDKLTDSKFYLDAKKIPSPLTGYISTLEELVGGTTVYNLIMDRLAFRGNEFKKHGKYIMGFLRLKTNNIEDGIEYAYLYHGNENPDQPQGLEIYLGYLSYLNKGGLIIIDSQYDFVLPSSGKLEVPGAKKDLAIWATHSLTNESIPVKNDWSFNKALDRMEEFIVKNTLSVDTHKPLEIKQLIIPELWKKKPADEKINSKGIGERTEYFSDPGMDLVHYYMQKGNNSVSSLPESTSELVRIIFNYLERLDVNELLEISDYEGLSPEIAIYRQILAEYRIFRNNFKKRSEEIQFLVDKLVELGLSDAQIRTGFTTYVDYLINYMPNELEDDDDDDERDFNPIHELLILYAGGDREEFINTILDTIDGTDTYRQLVTDLIDSGMTPNEIDDMLVAINLRDFESFAKNLIDIHNHPTG